MQFILPSYESLLLNPSMTVEHGGMSHKWSISAFSLKSIFDRDDMITHMFSHINRYWQTRSQEDQLAIFSIYVQMREAFDSPAKTEYLTAQLQDCLQRLYELHKFDHVENWVKFSSKIYIPGSDYLDVDFVENDDKNHTRAKTYTINDYIGLVSMIVLLRLMVPIWGEYVAVTASYYSTNHKEFNAMLLLENASIMTSEPMMKLINYVKERSPEEGNNTAIIEMVSSEQYPYWIAGLLIVRRLCLADIRGEVDPSAVLVRHISRHVHERIKRTDNSFGGVIKPKTDSNLKGSEENQISLVEGYKIKPELTEGDIGTIRHYVRDPYRVAQQLMPGIDNNEVKQALKSFQLLKDQDFKDSQIMLLQWMIDPVIPARGVDFLNNATIAKLLCVCQAVLWAQGHEMMAALATSIEQTSFGMSASSDTGTKGRLTKEITDDIHAMYPFQRRTRAGKLIMEPISAIDNMVAEFSNHAWTMTLNEKQIAEINPKNPQSKRLLLPHNFRMKVAEFVLYIARRPFISMLELN